MSAIGNQPDDGERFLRICRRNPHDGPNDRKFPHETWLYRRYREERHMTKQHVNIESGQERFQAIRARKRRQAIELEERRQRWRAEDEALEELEHLIE